MIQPQLPVRRTTAPTTNLARKLAKSSHTARASLMIDDNNDDDDDDSNVSAQW